MRVCCVSIACFPACFVDTPHARTHIRTGTATCWVNLPTFKANSFLIRALDKLAALVSAGIKRCCRVTERGVQAREGPFTKEAARAPQSVQRQDRAQRSSIFGCVTRINPPPLASPRRVPAHPPAAQVKLPSRVTTYVEMAMGSSITAKDHTKVLMKSAHLNALALASPRQVGPSRTANSTTSIYISPPLASENEERGGVAPLTESKMR